MEEELQDFYGRFGQTSLTVLGLWATVLSFRYDRWVGDRLGHRTAAAVSLIFGLPGVMSFLSLIDSSDQLYWRLSFFAGGALGAVVILTAVTIGWPPATGAGRVARPVPIRLGLGLSGLMFAAIGVMALLSSDLDPLEAEAVLLTLLLSVGLTLAWLLLFTWPAHPER